MAIVKKEKISTPSNATTRDGASINAQHLYGCVGGKGIVTLQDHSKLKHLDWLTSGHTNFAGIQLGTTAEWEEQRLYIVPKDMLIVYTDYKTYTDETGKVIEIPGIKVGTGLSYLMDLPFITDSFSKELTDHVNDTVRHITSDERTDWNDKLNCEEPVDDLLVFTRD